MHQRSVFAKAADEGSPKQQKESNSLPKMSVPSIPSRFLTPAMDMAPKSNVNNKNDHIQSIDGFQMSRLVDEPSKVGPQSYFPIYEQTNPIPKGTINWINSKSVRAGIPNPIMTQPLVGPGYYNLHAKVDRSIQNMSIPRQGRNIQLVTARKHKEAVSISVNTLPANSALPYKEFRLTDSWGKVFKDLPSTKFKLFILIL